MAKQQPERPNAAFLSSGRRRLELALIFSGPRRTLYEAAVAMGTDSGSIRSGVHNLASAGVLETDDPSHSAGAHYWLNESWRSILEEALEHNQTKGYLLTGQRVLELQASSATALAPVLSRRDLSSIVAWMFELGGDLGRWTLIRRQNTSAVALARLVADLEEREISCRLGQVGEMMSSQKTQRYVKAIQQARKSASA